MVRSLDTQVQACRFMQTMLHLQMQRKINLDTGELSDVTGSSVSLGDFYYKDKNGKVRYLHDGKATLAHRDVGINEQGSITWNGKAIADSAAMDFLRTKNAVQAGWTPVVYDNGKYDIEMVQPNGWVFDSEQGWYYPKEAEGEGEWRWYAADGSGAGSDTESNKGVWLYTNDEMLSGDRKRYSTKDGLGVYMNESGEWSTLAGDLLDSDGSGTFDEEEMLEHLKNQKSMSLLNKI